MNEGVLLKYLALLITFIPTIFWATSLIGLFFFNQSILMVGFFLALIPAGMMATKLQVKHQNIFFRPIISRLGKLPDDQWIPIELEKSGTEDRLHIVADEFGVIYKSINRLHIITAKREIASGLPEDFLILAKINKYSLSCCLVGKQDRSPVCEYNFSPKYSGIDLEIAGSSEKRIAWLSEWMGVGYEQIS